MGINQPTQTVDHVYKYIEREYKYVKKQITSIPPEWLLVGWILIFLVFAVTLLLWPISFGGEKVADETVDEKKWEIILQSIVSVGTRWGHRAIISLLGGKEAQ